MKLAHRHLFAVLFSFQRTIALSDLISLSRHFSFVKQIFLFFFAFFVPFAVWPTADIILPFYLSSVNPIFSDFIGIFVSAHTCPFRQLRWHFSQGKASHSLLQRRSAPRKVVRLPPVIRDGFSVRVIHLFFCLAHSKTTCNTCTFCLDSSLRSRMTSKYLLPLKKRNSLLPPFLSGVKHT